ncbi:uncharacterized protein [Onthophagus taurus]|uniref:uncharacterized protein n=1 Tax=Onthophagus taurus TaxID=166361 RepID=UPI0039BE3329
MQILKYVEDDLANNLEVDGDYVSVSKRILMHILQLPSEPVWHTCVCVMCYLTVIGHTVFSVNGKCHTHLREYKFISIFYIVDIALAIDTILTAISIYYKKKYPELRVIRRRSLIIFIEIMSVLPIEFLSKNPKMMCTLTLNRTLRIILIVYFNSKRTDEIQSGIHGNKLIEICSYLVFLTLLSYGIYCNYQCHANDNCDSVICSDTFMGALSCMVTSIGYEDNPDDTLFLIINVVVQMVVFYFVSAAASAYFSVSYVTYFFNQVIYSNCTLGMIDFVKQLQSPKFLQDRIYEEFHLAWAMKRTYCYDLSTVGYSMGTTFLHPSMYNELMIDIAWVSFKHSHLFRNVDFHYLRYLSNYVALEYKLPGEYLYITGEWKNKMIYISSGTIEIISNEDKCSSILSLCEGTLIGACTLLFGYRSSHYIQCKTFCEFHILRKSEFIKASQFFPEEFKAAKNKIYERYNGALEAHAMSVRARKSVISKKENVDSYTLLWVKNTLHRLMATDADSTYRHEFQNIYLTTEVEVEAFSKLLFNADFFDMLVVKERLQVDTDSVFVRNTFPFIFQPNSILAIAWQGVITVLIILVSFAIPYVAFVVEEPPNSYFWIIRGATHVYLLDVCIQLSTATKSRHAITVTHSATIKARLQTVTFWLDVGALVPTEAFMCILSTVVDSSIKAQLQLNRLLKIYRLKLLFDVWDQQFSTKKLTVRYVKYFCLVIYGVFVLYCVLSYWLKWYKVPEEGHLMFKAAYIFTKSFVYRKFTPPHVFFPFLNILTEIFRILMFSNIMAGFVMETLSKFQIQQMYGSVTKVLTPGYTHKYEQRILQIIELEWYQNRCNRLRSSDKLVCMMSQFTYSEFMTSQLADVLKTVEFFNDFSDDLIADICEIFYITVLPPNEAVIYGGDLSNVITLIFKGTYDIFNEYGVYTTTKNTPTVINLIEALMNIPSINTVTSVTHCRIFYMNANRFRSLLVKHTRYASGLLQALKASDDLKIKLHRMSRKNVFDVNQSIRIKEKRRPKFYYFTNLVADSDEEIDYHLPFDRIHPFSFIRYFFMRKTVDPHCNFIKYWETFRCICAILTGMFTFIINAKEMFIILLILDFAALIDIYLRFHFAYYDENGVLIYHPLATAKNYITGAFAIDFLGMFPTSFLQLELGGILELVQRANKLLPMYRYIGFCMTFIQYKITPVAKPYGLVFIPVILVLSCVSAAIIIVLQCEVITKDDGLTLKCVKGNTFEIANMSDPISPIHAQLSTIYMSCSMLTPAGIQGFIIPEEIQVFAGILIFIGTFLTVTFAGRFITLYSFTHGTLLKYQNDIKSLLTHMNSLKVSSVFQKQLIANYEIKYKMIQTNDVHAFLGQVSQPLKLDVLYDLYGIRLAQVSVFTKGDMGFYRNLLPLMNYNIISKDGFLGRCNDVGSDIYIVYSGVVQVLNSMGKQERVLYVGSMFGNMNNREYIRYVCSFQAATHVEYFHLPALEFFKILKYYPTTCNEFIFFRSIFSKYIAAHKVDINDGSVANKLNFKGFVFRHNTKRMKSWKFFILVFVCYFGNILNSYQLSVQEYSQTILTLMYIFDVAYVLDYYITSRTSYIDKTGSHVTNLDMIQQYRKRNKFLYVMRIIGLIPFEIPVLLLYSMEKSSKYLLYSIARSNRYCRLIFIFTYFTQKSYRLNVNVYLMRLSYIFLWTTVALTIITMFIIAPSSYFWTDDIYPPIPHYKTMFDMNSTEKFMTYVNCLHLATDFISFTPQLRFHPVSIGYIILFTIIRILSLHLMYLCYSQIYCLVDQYSFHFVQFRDSLQRLENFMKREDVSVALYDRIMHYVRKRWSRKATDVFPALMEKAPLYLREDILMSVFGTILTAQPVFESCNNDLLRQIAGKIRTRIFYRQDYIQFEGVIDECMYFILEGEVIVTNDSGIMLKTLKGGEAFGVQQGVDSKAKHEFTYMAGKNSTIGILNSNNWKYLLGYFPVDEIKIRSFINEFRKSKKVKIK